MAAPSGRQRKWTEADISDATQRAYEELVFNLLELKPVKDEKGGLRPFG